MKSFLIIVSLICFGLPIISYCEENPAELIKQTIETLSHFKTEWDTESRLRALARMIPPGKQVPVTLVYEVYKPASAEETEIKTLNDILPPETYTGILQSGNPRMTYVAEQKVVVGTGEDLARGAPLFPPFAEREQGGAVLRPYPNRLLNYLQWNSYKNKLDDWRAKNRVQISSPGSALSVIPQVDKKWLTDSKKVLDLLEKDMPKHKDPLLHEAYDILKITYKRAQSNPTQSRKDPGGILLDRKEGDLIAGKLAIQRVHLDSDTGILTVQGMHSSIGLDIDLLATALSLAFKNEEDVSFSLDPVDPKTVYSREDAMREEFIPVLEKRLQTDAELARRFIQQGFFIRDYRGQPHLIGYLHSVDPLLDEEIGRKYQEYRVQILSFHPSWLSRTRFGEILYRADETLKELMHGSSPWKASLGRTLDVPSHLNPVFWEPSEKASVYGTDLTSKLEESQDIIEALKVNKGSASLIEKLGGIRRFWFIPGGHFQHSSTHIDLSEVNPVLMVGGKFNKPCPFTEAWDRRATAEVTKHFDDYAKVIPEWEELRQIFRAYVLALWLREHASGGFSELLASLPPPEPLISPLPSQSREPLTLVARLDSEVLSQAKFEQAAIYGGITFERNLLKTVENPRPSFKDNPDALAWAEENSVFIHLSIPGIQKVPSSVPTLWLRKPTDRKFVGGEEPTMEGYQIFRNGLLKEKGVPLAWLMANLGLAGVLACLTMSFLAAWLFHFRYWPNPAWRFSIRWLISFLCDGVLFFVLMALFVTGHIHLFPFVGLVKEADVSANLLPWWGWLITVIVFALIVRVLRSPWIVFAAFCLMIPILIGTTGKGILSVLFLAMFWGLLIPTNGWIVWKLIKRSGSILNWFKEKITGKSFQFPYARVAMAVIGMLLLLIFLKPSLSEMRLAWTPSPPNLTRLGEPLAPLTPVELYTRMASLEKIPLSRAQDPRSGLTLIVFALGVLSPGVAWVARSRKNAVYAADWRFVKTTSASTRLYIDNNSIKVSGSNIFFTVRDDQYRDGIDYGIFDWQIDYQNWRSRYTKGWVHWTGKNPEFVEPEGQWEPIENGTWVESLATKYRKQKGAENK